MSSSAAIRRADRLVAAIKADRSTRTRSIGRAMEASRDIARRPPTLAWLFAAGTLFGAVQSDGTAGGSGSGRLRRGLRLGSTLLTLRGLLLS